MLRVTMVTLAVLICLAVTANGDAEGEGSHQHYRPAPQYYRPSPQHYRPGPQYHRPGPRQYPSGPQGYQPGSRYGYNIEKSNNEKILFKVRFGEIEDMVAELERSEAEIAGPADGTLRIVGEPDKGRLEIIYFGLWGTICANQFTQAAAIVACNELGKPSGNPGVLTNIEGTYGNVRTLPIWHTDLRCTSEEARLVDCGFREFLDENCFHSQDVGIWCKD